MPEIFSSLIDGLTSPIAFFINPAQRLFIPALLSSLLMAVGAYVYFQHTGRLGSGQGFRHLLGFLFPKRIWTHRSSVLDYQVMLFNGVAYVFLTAPFLVYVAMLTDGVNGFWTSILGEAATLDWSHTRIVVLYTIVLFLFDDFLRFFQHWLFHKLPFMWLFHKVHHSALVLTPFTNYRNHPVETFIFHCRRLISYGVVTGSFLYLVGNDLTLLDVFYAGMARKIFNHIGSNLRHSHIWISWGHWMEHIFISPAQHQIHHSNALEHRDKNMGSALAIWDWMFGTLVMAGEYRELELGIGEAQNRRFTNLRNSIINPFIDAGKMMWRNIPGSKAYLQKKRT